MIVPLAFAFTSLVEGETCPASGVVEERVRAILQLPQTRELTESFAVERREAGLFVELRSEQGAIIGQRTLPKEGTCEELAQAAAVVLSAWLNDAHPDFAGALPERSTDGQSEPSIVPPPPLASSPAPALRAPAERREPPPNPTHDRASLSYRGEVALGVGADFSVPKAAVAGALRLAFMPHGSGLGVSVTALIDASRREDLGEGSVLWRRWPLAFAPTLRLAGSSWELDASLGPALSWVHLAGQGFEPDRRQDGVTMAAFGDLRLASRRKLGAWLGFSALAYLADSTAYVGADRYALPTWTLAACIGARFAP